MILGITTNKARNILLKEKRCLTKDKPDISLYETTYVALRFPNKRISSRKTTLKCIKCGKPYKNEDCWKLYSEKASK